MNIKRLLKIVIFFVVFIFCVFITLIYFSFSNHRQAEKKVDVANKIAFEVFQRRLVGDDYLLHPSERAKLQWFSKQVQVEHLVQTATPLFQSDREKELIATVQKGLQDSRDSFTNIVLLYETEKNATTSAFENQKENLATELTVKAQTTVSAASKLNDINEQASHRTLQQTTLFFILTTSSFFLILLLCFGIIWKNATLLDQTKAEDEAMLASIGDGVFAIDTKEEITLFNRAAETITGYTREEAMNQPYKKIFHFYNEKDNSIVDSFIATALLGKKAEMAQRTMLKRKNHMPIPVADSAAPITNSEGIVTGAVIVFRDISKEHELEKMKDEFVSIASHELRTPLTAIRGLVSMIFEGDFGTISDNLKEPIGDIVASTDRLIHLVNDLLDVSRIEAGRTKFILVDIHIDTVIQQIVSSLQPLAKHKNITLTANKIPDITVQGDKDKIIQVLNNVIGNAIKFTDKGGITLTAQADSQKELATIFITDTGIGMFEKNQEDLFGKFEQLDTQSGRPPGTGLGLYISRELARKMGGDLWLERSEVGKGTTFGFSLPLANSEKANTIKDKRVKEAALHT